VTLISTYHTAEIQTVIKRGEEKQTCMYVCVIHYNQHRNEWCRKLFRRLCNATVVISVFMYRKNMGWKDDHLKCRIYLVECLLVKYSFYLFISTICSCGGP
jgi:hypothetical protein